MNRQPDLQNAFLHGHLKETIFIEPPPGFTDPAFPNHVCQLKHALYGLKQAPIAWFERLPLFLIHLGYSCGKADSSFFFFFVLNSQYGKF